MNKGILFHIFFLDDIIILSKIKIDNWEFSSNDIYFIFNYYIIFFNKSK